MPPATRKKPTVDINDTRGEPARAANRRMKMVHEPNRAVRECTVAWFGSTSLRILDTREVADHFREVENHIREVADHVRQVENHIREVAEPLS